MTGFEPTTQTTVGRVGYPQNHPGDKTKHLKHAREASTTLIDVSKQNTYLWVWYHVINKTIPAIPIIYGETIVLRQDVAHVCARYKL